MKYCLFGLLLIGVLGYSCKNTTSSETSIPEETNLSGEELAKIHCGSCHLVPNPKDLPRDIWMKSVLPKMALRLGHGDLMGELMNYSTDEMMAIAKAGVYPDKPMLANEDWQKILKYYIENAPDSLKENQLKPTQELLTFKLNELKVEAKEVVLTKFDSSRNQISVGASVTNTVFSISGNRKISDLVITKSPIVDIGYHKNLGKVSLEVGILNPSDLPEGRLMAGSRVLIDKLHRPVSMVLADLNDDNYEDFIISNFGNLRGSLAWYDGKTFKENVLSNEPGARVVYHIDFDRDGKKDILALMTQGREGIMFYKNTGRGSFEMKPLLHFPPHFGSSYFDIKDLDMDGDLDFVHTNGDNADFSIIAKPFHGLRVFLNNGKAEFSQAYFYPINGASKVIAEDFDGDKNLDLAVVSFFPDIKRNEGFLYFEGLGNMKFKVLSKKKLSDHKWLTIDSGDFDKDGDKDIVLGAFNRNLSIPPKVSAIVILDNLKKK